MATYEYQPTKHHLLINRDGARWITWCRDYFGHNATFVIDRFRDIRQVFRGHPRYRPTTEKLDNYDWKGVMSELNSAIGSMENDKKEQHESEAPL